MSSVTREEVIELLKAAACPASCDNGVVVRDQLHGEIEQCQFCYERDQVIAALQEASPAAVPDERSHLIALLGVMCGWFEDLAKIAGWTPDNANAAWAGYRAAKAAIAPSRPAPAAVPDEAFNIVEGIRAEITWGGWRSAYSRDWVMDRLSELLSMLTASPAPDHAADVRKMVAPDVSELEKAAQKLWRESYNCESDFIQAVIDALSKQEEAER